MDSPKFRIHKYFVPIKESSPAYSIMAVRKRPIKEVDLLDLLTKPVPNTNIHGGVISLSPVIKGRNVNYFDET